LSNSEIKTKDIFTDAIKAGKIKVDYNGHHKSGSALVDFSDAGLEVWDINYRVNEITGDFLFWLDLDYPLDTDVLGIKPKAELSDLRIALRAGEEIDWIDLIFSSRCSVCNEPLRFQTNGKIIRVTDPVAPCEYPDGLKEFTVEIDVPSGQLVFDNDLRSWFDVKEEYSINHTKGIMQTAEAYAEKGMIHLFVGNTCPGVFSSKDDGATTDLTSLKIGNPIYYDEDDEEKDLGWGKPVASICTDLWWFCAVDLDLLHERMEDSKETQETIDQTLRVIDMVDVIPGRYRATSYYQDTGDSEPIYARIDLIEAL